MKRMVLHHRYGKSLLAAVAAATALVAFPVAAHADDAPPLPVAGSLPLTNTTEQIGPGINLQHVKALAQSGWYDAQFLTVDLSNSAVGTNLLTSGPVASGGPLSAAVNQAGAVAGINGEFFDIGNSNAAEGAGIQSGQLIKTSDVPQRPSVGVSDDGIAQLVDTTVNATANFSGSNHPVLSINAADPSGISANGLIAYTAGWDTYSRNRALTGVANDQIAEVLSRTTRSCR